MAEVQQGLAPFRSEGLIGCYGTWEINQHRESLSHCWRNISMTLKTPGTMER